MNFVIVALGAIFGANLRYVLSRLTAKLMGPVFPYGTLIINVAGSFIVGWFMIWTTERVLVDPRWRLLITMKYQGTCTFILFCSGPSARVLDDHTGGTVDSFDLGEGTAKARIEQRGPGVYEIRVSPGSDSAQWQIAVEDRY